MRLKRSVLHINGVRSLFKPISEEIQEDVRARYSQSKNIFICWSDSSKKNVAKLIQAFDLFCLKTKADFQLLIVGRKAWMTDETEAVWQNSPNKSRIQFYSLHGYRAIGFSNCICICSNQSIVIGRIWRSGFRSIEL